MSARTAAMIASLLFLAACGAGTPPVKAPAAATPEDETETETEAEDDAEPAWDPRSERSADGLYVCRELRPDANVEVSLKPGFTVRDLAVWYLGVTCAKVVLLADLEDRTHAAGIDAERMTGAELHARFDRYLDEMGLVAIRGEHGLVLIIDKTWAAPGPTVLRVSRTPDEVDDVVE